MSPPSKQRAKLPFGTVGMPPGVKEGGQRADFRTDSFVINIEGHGYRLAWTRATLCPCAPLNTQTRQSNPNCPQCEGAGFFYFGDAAPQDPARVGLLNEAQAAIVKAQGAYVIRAIMTSLSSDTQVFRDIGGWRTGQCNVTTRSENKLAYGDRLVAIDSTIAYYEVVVCDATAVIPARYLVDGGVMLVMDQSFRRYLPDVDFCVQVGKIVWLRNQPPAGTRLSLHYMTHPTWIVMSYPHTVRNAYIAAKKPVPNTPEGDYYDLPIQATAKLEFLVHQDES